MHKRAEQLYEIWRKSAYPHHPNMWGHFNKIEKRGWYEVAAAEIRNLERYADDWKTVIGEMKAEMATMVKRKHYTDAIKSLATCQQQIETLVVELRKHNPLSQIVNDATIVMDLLEAMIMANPDMQTTDWKADAKAKADEAEEKRRAVVQAAMWKDEPSYSDGWVRGAVGKGRKP